jgi:hypothetical protein
MVRMLVAARSGHKIVTVTSRLHGSVRRLSNRRLVEDSLRPGRSTFVLHANQMNGVVEFYRRVITVDN